MLMHVLNLPHCLSACSIISHHACKRLLNNDTYMINCLFGSICIPTQNFPIHIYVLKLIKLIRYDRPPTFPNNYWIFVSGIFEANRACTLMMYLIYSGSTFAYSFSFVQTLSMVPIPF